MTAFRQAGILGPDSASNQARGTQLKIPMVKVGNMGRRPRSEPATYQIQVEGCLVEDWSDWFEGLIVTVQSAGDGSHITCLTGVVEDQPALRGLLCRIWDMNLTLVSLIRLGSEAEKGWEC